MVLVKTKNIEIIRFTTIFNELHFMTGTDIFLPDYSRKHLPIKNDWPKKWVLDSLRSNVGLLNWDMDFFEKCWCQILESLRIKRHHIYDS